MTISRRDFVALPLALAVAPALAGPAAARTRFIHLHDISLAAPDIIRLTLRDQEIKKGELIEASRPDPGNLNATIEIEHPGRGIFLPAKVVGRGGTHLRFYDDYPEHFVDRAAVDRADDYVLNGGFRVQSVYRVSMPYDQGTAWAGQARNCVSFEHQIFLKLDKPAAGSVIAIRNRRAQIDTRHDFHDTRVRASSIHATQAGHRPGDGSKIAYLSQWIPGYGDEGRIDFLATLGTERFFILDQDSHIVWKGIIESQLKADDIEDAAPPIAYPSTVVPPKRIESIARGNRTEIEITGHGYATGQKKCFRGVAGLDGLLEAKTFDIEVIDEDRFIINLDTASAGRYRPGTYAEGFDSLVYDAILRNRSATDVFRLDYSDFRPKTSGTFRVHIPGLGCSDPFRIDEAVHYDAAHHSMKGYYNQCWGMALVRETGGWNRPVNYRDGVNGVEIFESTLPACMDGETGISTVSLERAGHAAPWITKIRAAGWYGGWSDAGDWDMHISRHGPAVWQLLDLGYEHLPEHSRQTRFGFPRSSQSFPQSGLYASIDDLPDSVHMAVYYVEPLRRFQKSDGRVFGGLTYDGNGGGSAGGGNGFEPSWISQQNAHLLAADHCSNLFFAACAAKLGRLLRDTGSEELGNIWIASGELAWRWADPILADYEIAGLEGSRWRNYYFEELGVDRKSGWDDGKIKHHFDDVQRLAAQARVLAAGSLLAATGHPEYQAVMEIQKGVHSQSGIPGMGVWDYVNCKHGQPAFKDAYRGRWNIWPDHNYAEHFTGKTSYVYAGGGKYFAPHGVPGELIRAFAAGQGDGKLKYIDLIHAGENFNTGANQCGLCCTTGLGARWPAQSLHRDREAMGLTSGAVPGLTLFMWWPDNSGGLYFFNFGDDDPLNFVVDRPTTLDNIHRVAEPYWRAIPAMQQHWQNTYVIYNTEFVTQEQIVGRYIANLWRHGWDGNPAPIP